ncbi:hypothetical protein CO083_06615 [Candidatus Roizmanbacteria bacterium CG_4_9_14_0_8_um_filter_34_12]|uniref:Haem-binding uptake Tiki superfamily ChaN domain-containing protein n=3 Tax=Candidatus Roizmaniibacteriota TaxID=1752723 RepID=A0A2H0C410_9BACT|nr:MAG: hypothetical protein COW96_01375 [Candidatus Roizmanbacteria bacterium CG22_combo_CG10-13_8_21_14_all_33_16]PJB87507.1 MAG: hypothetical protein CO083_06615 [Candidatus Roizmanbacteria bacterium CG_4_9_14_0_8_um_filter_34_12]
MDIQEGISYRMINQKDPYGSLTQLEVFFANNRRPVDFSKIVSPQTRVLVVGEKHTRELGKSTIIQHMGVFRELGFTHFGMEMLDGSRQVQLEQALLDNDISSILLCLHGYTTFSPNAAQLYIQLANTAFKTGMCVIAMHPKYRNQTEQDFTTYNEMMNQNMSRRIIKVLREKPYNRMVVFTGNAHAAREGRTMTQLLVNRGVDLVSAGMVGGRRNKQQLNMEKAARRIHAEEELFMVVRVHGL